MDPNFPLGKDVSLFPFHPLGPPAGERRGDDAVGHGPTCKRERKADGVGWSEGGGGGEPAGARPSVRPRGGSPLGSRFCDDGVVPRHGRG
jgi:hypothetical protein